MKSCALVFGVGLLFALFSANSAKAGDYIGIKTFFKTVVCSRIPLSACQALDATNARNLMTTYRATLSTRFCGTGNINRAKVLYQIDKKALPDRHACQELLRVTGKMP